MMYTKSSLFLVELRSTIDFLLDSPKMCILKLKCIKERERELYIEWVQQRKATAFWV